MTETALPRRRRLRHALALPNLLTYGRLVAVPVVAALLQSPAEHWMRWTALAVFTVAGVTDFLDGYLARIWKQQSPLGQMLDPIADKLLVATTLLVLAANQTLDNWTLWAAIIILCREILVSGLREYLAEKATLPVSALAKWKTTVQMIALGFFIAGPAGEAVAPGAMRIGAMLLWLAAALTLYTGVDYLISGWPHFGEEEEA
ncbi:MAG TPA: CDP-diacylglycerol--glycerol-3-phosphate 3-phosphatidyltransferase [Methylocystis sp.]|nr:CDP-diacylglycerol--glycerol-3-phosphate 3-phosphatidyltransferase [Methylocystis sp.]